MAAPKRVLSPKRAPNLNVEDFRENPGTGTATDPDEANDNNTGTYCTFDVVGEYVQFDFPFLATVDEFRYYGHLEQAGNGDYKIQYWNGSAWVDLNTGISTRVDSWSSWTSLTKSVETDKVRWVATTLDENGGDASPLNVLGEVEMRGITGGLLSPKRTLTPKR